MMPSNDAAGIVRRQRSVRDFTSQAVDAAVLDAIFDAARAAPTAGGMHSYSVVVTRDPQRVEQYRQVHQGNFAALSAPVLLTYCVDQRRLSRWLPLLGGRASGFSFWGFLMGVMDASMFAQNVNLVVRDFGLAGSFVGSAVNYANEVAAFLECPPGVVPLITYAVGHPAGEPRGRTRLPASILVHEEVYRDQPDEALRAAYAEHGADMFALYTNFPGLDAAADALGVDNMAGMWSRVAYVSEQVEAAATWYLTALRQQGFLDTQALARLDAFAGYRESEFYDGLSMFSRIAFTFMVNRGCFDGMDAVAARARFAAFMSFLAGDDPVLQDALASPATYLLSADLADRLTGAMQRFFREDVSA